jgi:hypothetical protein
MSGPLPCARWPRLATWLLFGLLAIFVLLTFRQHGISNDEEVQHIYGRLLLDFYGSVFADHAAFEYKNLYLYGGLFDLIAAALERVLPVGMLDVWDLRHLLSALFGVTGIVAAWKLARRLADEQTAVLAAILLVLTGAWSGAMFTHTKDVPFAACMMWALYYITLVVSELPSPRPRIVIKLGVALGCAFGLRVGAAFAVLTLIIAVGIATTAAGGRDWRERGIFLARSAVALLPAGLICALLTAAFWPWVAMAPENVFLAVRTFSRFSFPMKTILDGEVMDIGEVPGLYLPEYLTVRLPELLLLGLALAFICAVSALRASKGTSRGPGGLRFAPLILAATVPIAYAWIAAPSLYNGIRHFLFVVPPAAVLAALGLRGAWLHLRPYGYAAPAMTAACSALAGWHLVTLMLLHPYEYVYYNQFAGGLPEASSKWATDYWSSSLRDAATQLESQVKESRPPDAPYRVAVCAETIQGQHYLGPRFVVTRDWRRADFFLSSTHLGCDRTLRGKVIATVTRLGVVLAVVVDRRHLPPALRAPLH